MNTRRIAEILLSTKGQEMTNDQKEAQRESFAYGNTYIENDEMTREAIREAAKTRKEIDKRLADEVERDTLEE